MDLEKKLLQLVWCWASKMPRLTELYLATLIVLRNCTDMLRNLTFVVQVAYFSIRPKKVFWFFSSNFWGTFVCFLSNYFEKYGKLFEKSRAACGKPNHSWLTSSHNGTEICYRDFITKWKLSFWRKSYMLNRHLTIRRRRRQRERHKSNRFN